MKYPFKRRPKLTRAWLAGGFVAFTLFFTVFGDRGLIKIYKLRKEIRKLKGVSEATQRHNDQLSEDIRRMVLEGDTPDKIRAQAIKEGMISLWRDGMLKVQSGLTTPYEVIRNVFSATA